MYKIELTRGLHTIVDQEDFERFGELSFYAHATGRTANQRRHPYARRDMVEAGIKKKVYLHRLILGITNPKIQVDHINGNTLDNRRSNLRLVSARQNGQNSRKSLSRKSSSKYKGVSWVKRKKKWLSQIYVTSRTLYLGFFQSEKAAAQAYNEAAIKHFGEFACLNVL